MDRRSFLLATGSLSAAALWSSRATGVTRRFPKLADHPFQLGVASGDPSSTGVVLWTRLAPKPLEGGGMPDEAVEVSWQVADDEQMTKIVQEGKTPAVPDWGHSVHVEVDGLQPDRWYWYQFKVGNDTSPKGRTRTAPAVGTTPERLRFAFASCQHFESGLYTAYEHMVREPLDLVIHLGDYIYEGPGRDGGVRKHVGPKLDSLSDYRNRHAQYKTDPHLQAMHAAAPWLVTWDDHEVENNYADGISEKGTTVENFLAQRARAYKAYYEHMPLRKSSLPEGPMMSLYRQVAFGDLANFWILDTRQYRSDQPCGDGGKDQCPEALDPSRTMLGAAQRQWLFEGLTSSPTNWNILAQQVMMARADRRPGEERIFAMDQWPGYEGDRRRVLKHFYDSKVKNPVVLTGDIHSSWANELIADFDDLDSAVVGTEFVGTSISSSGNGDPTPKYLPALYAENPFVKYHNQQRGYVSCQVTPQQWRTDYQGVDYTNKPGAPLVTRASFVVESGSPVLHTA
ncbi:MAG: alkaline phosphatase D family protein [Pirellulales bacterium]|nr:alkaline phosphatase D family protein [Pirellulales bacterium]